MRIYDNPPLKTYLAHHGIKGQKWGIRRFRNPDGTLTEEGKKRYGGKSKGLSKEEYSRLPRKERFKYAEDCSLPIFKEMFNVIKTSGDLTDEQYEKYWDMLEKSVAKAGFELTDLKFHNHDKMQPYAAFNRLRQVRGTGYEGQPIIDTRDYYDLYIKNGEPALYFDEDYWESLFYEDLVK